MTKKINIKPILFLARTLSAVFTPFYLPIVGLALLFSLSYLNVLPWQYVAHVMFITICFTLLLPSLLIRFYRHYHGWTLFELRDREKRMLPYIISIACYLVCLHLMHRLRMPHVITGIIVAAVTLQMVCAMINTRWKICIHTAAIGGVTGVLMVYSLIFDFNPVWWLCLVMLISGMLGTSRMLLRLNTLSQVTLGYIIGCIIAAVTVLLY